MGMTSIAIKASNETAVMIFIRVWGPKNIFLSTNRNANQTSAKARANPSRMNTKGKWLTEASASRGEERNISGVASIRKPHASYTSRSQMETSKTKNKMIPV